MRYWLYRLKFWAAQYYRFKGPVHIDIELNNTCNQHCVFCWHSLDKKPFDKQIMHSSNVKQYLREGRELGALSVKFNLRGEPSLYPELPEVIRYAKDLGYVDTMINTNGQFSYTRMADIVRAGIDTIIFSMDSFVPGNYAKLHGCEENNWYKLVTNLLLLDSFHKQRGLRVYLNYHVNEINQGESWEFYNNNLSSYPVRIRNTMKREGKDVSLIQSKRKRKKRCLHMMRRLTVLANGKIYPCCVCYTEPKDIELPDSLRLAWKIGNARNLLYKRGHLMKSCKNCTSADIWKTR